MAFLEEAKNLFNDKSAAILLFVVVGVAFSGAVVGWAGWITNRSVNQPTYEQMNIAIQKTAPYVRDEKKWEIRFDLMESKIEELLKRE